MPSFKELGVNYIGLELNNTCNLSCSYCPMNKSDLRRSVNKLHMDSRWVFKLLEEIREDGTLDYVILNDYGEPFIYPKFEAVLAYCHSNNIKTRFGTNGTQFTEHNMELIKTYSPQELVISLQYFYENDFIKVHGAYITRRDYLKGIADFIKYHIANNLDTVVQIAIADNPNNRFIHKILGLRLGDQHIPYPDKQYYNKLQAFVKEFCEEYIGLPFNPMQVKLVRNSVYSKYYQIDSRISFEIKHFSDLTNYYKFKPAKKVSCRLDYLIINTSGDVLMCCADYLGGTSLGNTQEQSIKRVLLNNYDLFTNKHNEKAGIMTCRKCYGEPTYRGLIMKGLYERL